MASCDDSLSSKIQDAQKTARSHLIAVASTMREAVLQGNARVSDLAWLAPQLIFISQFVTADKNFTNHQRTILTESIAALLNCMKDPAGFYATLENGEPDEADLAASHFMHCLSTSGGAGVCQSDYQEALGDEHLVAVVEFLDGIDEDLALPVSTLTHIWARNKLVRFAAIVRFMLRECDVHTTINKSYPRVFIGLPLADAKRVMQEFPKLLPAVQKLAGLLGF